MVTAVIARGGRDQYAYCFRDSVLGMRWQKGSTRRRGDAEEKQICHGPPESGPPSLSCTDRKLRSKADIETTTTSWQTGKESFARGCARNLGGPAAVIPRFNRGTRRAMTSFCSVL